MNKLIKLFIPLFLIIVILSGNNSKNYKFNRYYYRGQRVLNAVDYLIEKSNMEGIKSYRDGIQREMYVFNHSDKDSVNEFIDYRYIGNDANNYVYFNCSDTSDLETCELWRVIGAFVTENSDGIKEYRLKIMSTKGIENMSWSDNGSSNWEESSLYSYLNNGDYWYSLKGKFQNMIDSVKFYTGKLDNSNLVGNSLYYKERENYVIERVGLITLSDYNYTYANGVNEGCFNNLLNCNDMDSSWMNVGSEYWTMISSNGVYTINNNISKRNVNENFDVYPVVYLKPNVGIESGNGSEGDAYVLRELKKSNYQNEEDMNIGDSDIKKEVYVDDTMSIISKVIFIACGIVIFIGIAIIVINYIKSRKEIK